MAGARPVELLERERIIEWITGSSRAWLKHLDIFEEIDSTNTHLVDLAQSSDVDGRVCLAERQTAGRGRRGRTWHSPSGRNIALSLGRRFDVPADGLRSLSLVVGLAVADAVTSFSIPGVALKWPNDILLGTGKLGGILIELVETGDASTVVIGVGLNVGSADLIRDEIGQSVADVFDASPDVSRNALAARLIDSIVDYGREFERAGFEPMRDAWLSLHAYHDQEVKVLIGKQAIHGVARGVSTSGELEVETADRGLRRFNAGEVTLRRA